MRNKHAEISKETNSNFLRIDDSSEEPNNDNMEWELSTGNISDNIIVKNETEVEEVKIEEPQSRIQDSNDQLGEKFIKEKLCLICDVESDSTSEAVKHMKEYHMSIISEQINQKFETGKLKNEHGNVAIDLKIQDVFQVRKLSDNVEVKELFELDNDSQIMPQLKNDDLNEILDRIESSSKFICQLCFVSHVTLQDLESHLSSFHRISLQSCRAKVVNFSKPGDVNL